MSFFVRLLLILSWLLAAESFRLHHVPPSTFSSRSLPSSSLSTLRASSFSSEGTEFNNVGIILLAGGTGSRMKATLPKQFLPLRSTPILHYSLFLFLETLPHYCEAHGLSGPPMVVLVLDPLYHAEYQPIVDKYQGKLLLANPGKERQDSVENGLQALLQQQRHISSSLCDYVAIHDSARPLVTLKEVLTVVAQAKQYGAAVLGVPCKATIKECQEKNTTSQGENHSLVFVTRTLPRSTLWEVHTPQVVRVESLLRGMDLVKRENLQVTDDVSIIEALGEPVKMTRGEYTNLKITTPEDMEVAAAILMERGDERVQLVEKQ